MGNRDAGWSGFGVMGSVLAGLLLLAGCASSGYSDRAGEPRLPVVVDQISNGAEIDLVPGQDMVIRLVRNLRENKTWEIVGDLDKKILEPMGQRTVKTVNARGEPGSKSIEELRFRGVSGGEVILDLAYLPEGGTLAQATNRYFLRVIVDRFQK